MQDLSFIRLFLAILLLLVSPALEFSVIHRHVVLDALVLCVIAALIMSIFVRSGRRLILVKCFSEVSFIRHHLIECMMAGFMIYFWGFSLIAGWYKPQFKNEYQMLHYESVWYYVLARYDDRLVLSTSYKSGSDKFVILNTKNTDNFEINMVRVR
ncbi:putative membrane protein [Escherichia coli STEC_MHI813]|nr:putative membrane protein [Escherichia coli STEC_MHI813]